MAMVRHILILGHLLLLSLLTQGQTNYRLLKTITPVNYDIDLVTNIEKFTASSPVFAFSGTVKILFKPINDTKLIQLHMAKVLQITSSTLTKGSTIITLSNLKPTPDATNEIVTFDVDPTTTPLKAGEEYLLTIEYEGTHTDDMYGFYRSSYKVSTTAGVEERWLLSTQFQSVYARRAFPCFDEPEFKATYNINITLQRTLLEKGYHVLSNMPCQRKLFRSTECNDAHATNSTLATIKFKSHGILFSTYLVAFIISDFKPSDPLKLDFNDTKEFKTWARSEYIDSKHHETSQWAGPLTMKYFEVLFGIEFPLDKLDQVAIPDFAAGAMENYGLTTYRENRLLFNEATMPLSTKQDIVQVTVHELTHQWFGNLVTLKWWNDIWLNEGFARYFQYFATQELKDNKFDLLEWDLESQFVVKELQNGAMQPDSLPSSRPVSATLNSPAEIQAAFDGISYAKAASILRMYANIAGEANFIYGLRKYLVDNKHGSTVPANLYAALDQGKPLGTGPAVPDFFSDWITKPGFPVISIQQIGKILTITQEQFLLLKPSATPATKWNIYLTYITNMNSVTPTAGTWIKTADAFVNVTLPDNADWYLFNFKQTGYYKVNYDGNNWKKLGDVLRNSSTFRSIHPINRAQIIDDSFSLARSTNKEYINYTIPLNIIEYMKHEDDYVPWVAATNQLAFLRVKVRGNSTLNGKFNSLLKVITKSRYVALGPNTRPHAIHTERLNRELIFSWACSSGVEECVKDATRIFEADLLSTTNIINPDIKSAVYCSGIRTGNYTVWDQVWTKFTKATDSTSERVYMSALGCSTNGTKLEELLKKTIDKTGGIRKQDRATAFSAVYNGNPGNVEIALKFLNENLQKIAKEYGGLNPLGGILTGIADKLGTAADLATMNSIKNKIKASSETVLKEAEKSVETAISKVQGNIDWIQSNQDSLYNWFKDYKGGSAMVGANFLVLILTATVALFNFIH